MPTLMLMSGVARPREIPLVERETRLGRSEHNHVVLNSQRVSRVHAVLIRQGHFVTIRDLRSTNGTFVNGACVATCALLDGDTIQLGDVELQFFDGDDKPSEAIEPPPRATDWDALAIEEDPGETRYEEELELPRPVGGAVLETPTGGNRGTAWIGDAVAFVFAAQGRRIAGLITYEALADHFGARAHAQEADADSRAVEAYVENAVAIHVAASLRYEQKHREPILLRTTDF